MYKCLNCNNDGLEVIRHETDIKLNLLQRSFIFFGLMKNPNTVSIEYYCARCERKYNTHQYQDLYIGDLPYYQNKFLMTKAENEFFKLVSKVIPKGTILIPQVALSSLVKTYARAYRNKVDRKSVDFVLFKDIYYNPLLVIELDDSSHDRIERIQRDKFVDLVLLKANLPIIHVKLTKKANEEELKKLIDEKLRIWKYDLN